MRKILFEYNSTKSCLFLKIAILSYILLAIFVFVVVPSPYSYKDQFNQVKRYWAVGDKFKENPNQI